VKLREVGIRSIHDHEVNERFLYCRALINISVDISEACIMR